MIQDEAVVIEPEKRRVNITVPKRPYSNEVIYAASYVFTDRCYVFLDRTEEGEIVVSLTGKEVLETPELSALTGEFFNELLFQLVRRQVGQKSSAIVEEIVRTALQSSVEIPQEEWMSEELNAGLDEGKEEEDLDLDLEEDLDFLDDPLGIAVPWEEKYGKENEAAAEDAAAGDTAAGDTAPEKEVDKAEEGAAKEAGDK